MAAQMRPKRQIRSLASLPAISRLTPLAATARITGQLVTTSSVALPLFAHFIWRQTTKYAPEAEELPYLPFLIIRDGELNFAISMTLHCLKIRLIEQHGMASERILPSFVFLEVSRWIAQWRERLSVLDERTLWPMNHLQCNTEVPLMMSYAVCFHFHGKAGQVWTGGL
jgi:hypothetical protein